MISFIHKAIYTIVKMARFFALLALVGVVLCDRVHFDGDKVLRITPKDDDEVVQVRGLEGQDNLDFWTEARAPGKPVDVHIPANAVQAIEKKLNAFGIKYSVLIEDLEKEVSNEEKDLKKNTFSNGFNYFTYNRLGAIHAETKRLQQAHSNIASMFLAGTSYEGRSMDGIKISTGGKKKAIWIDGCIHAREWVSCASVVFFMKQLLEPEPVFADRVSQVLAKYDFYILPVFNVDGYEYSHTRNRMWRKTRSRGRYCFGADPNRNWDSKWGGVGTSPNECADTYHGKGPFSEIEVKQVANMLTQISRNQGLLAYWNIHAYSQLVLHPWSYTTNQAPDYPEISRVAHVFADGIRQQTGKIFRPGQPSRILYSVAGGSMDWTYEKLGVIYSYAPEMRPAQGEFRNGFLLPARYIHPSGMEFTNGMLNAVLQMRG